MTWPCFAQEAFKATPTQSSLLAVSYGCISHRQTYRKSECPCLIAVLENAACACLFAWGRGMTDAAPLLRCCPYNVFLFLLRGFQQPMIFMIFDVQLQLLALLMPHPGLVRRSACSRSKLTSRSPGQVCLQNFSLHAMLHAAFHCSQKSTPNRCFHPSFSGNSMNGRLSWLNLPGAAGGKSDDWPLRSTQGIPPKSSRWFP